MDFDGIEGLNPHLFALRKRREQKPPAGFQPEDLHRFGHGAMSQM